MNGFELILPFPRPIEALILDPEISGVMVNDSDRIFVEKPGRILPISDVSQKSLGVAGRNTARRLGDDISEEKPILDSRLPDGSRVAAVLRRVAGRRLHQRQSHDDGVRWDRRETVSDHRRSSDLCSGFQAAVPNAIHQYGKHNQELRKEQKSLESESAPGRDRPSRPPNLEGAWGGGDLSAAAFHVARIACLGVAGFKELS